MIIFGPQQPRRTQRPDNFRTSRRSVPPSPHNLMMPLRPPRPNSFTQPPKRSQNQVRSELLSMIQTPEGKFDLEKVTGTVQQISKIYGQVSPILTKFIKR